MDRSSIEQMRGQLSVCAFDLTQTKEVSGELTMPDYFPEIRKVISVTADALPDTKYLSDQSLEIGGCVAFSLLYIGDDGALSCVPYVTEYTQSFPVGRDFQGGSADIRMESTADSIFCRPLAPRTVSLKARVKSRVCADKWEDASLSCSGDDGTPVDTLRKKSLEKLERSVSTVGRKAFFATGSTSGEEHLQSHARPILCRGEVLVDSASAGHESVTVSGDIICNCLLQSDDGSYRALWKRLPFEEQINAEGVDTDYTCAAFGRVASTAASINEGGELTLDCDYDIDVVCAKKSAVSIVDDAYSTAYSLDSKRQDMSVQSLVCLENKTVTVSAQGRRKAERSEGDHVVFCTAEAKIERADASDGRICFTGEVTFKALVTEGGDASTEEISAPVSFDIPTDSDADGNIVYHAFLSPSRIECTLDDSTVFAKCELYAFAEAVREMRCAPVTEACFGASEKSNQSAPSIRICYPEKGRRIWDIAKECRAALSECERRNKISRCDLSDGSPLIVK